MPSVLPLVMGRDAPRHFHRLRSSRSIYTAVVVFLLVVFPLSGLFFVRAINVEQREDLAQKDAIARTVAASIAAREQGCLNVLRSSAGRPGARGPAHVQDEEERAAHYGHAQPAS